LVPVTREPHSGRVAQHLKLLLAVMVCCEVVGRLVPVSSDSL
jgi:hypothetical protein